MRARRSGTLVVAALWATVVCGFVFAPEPVRAQGLKTSDLSRFRSVGAVQLNPDGHTVAYTVTTRDRPGRPSGQIWIMDLSTQKTARLGDEKSPSGDPHWSPDGKWLAYSGSDGTQSGLMIARADGSGATFLAPVSHSNVPLPGQGSGVSWSPDGKRIAFVSATPGPETANATGDPVVITRYLYRPQAGEGASHFNDNRRLHIFLVDVGSKQVRQLTSGTHDEHSIDWSPDGKEILFVSSYDANSDEYFNYDDFAVNVADGAIRRITATESAEYSPRWSPDGKWIAYSGTTRGLTDRETTMEDTHVWLMAADGSNRRDIGGVIDGRQGSPQWAPDGSAVYFTVQLRGSTHLIRLPISAAGVAGQPETVVGEVGGVTNYSVGKGGQVVYGMATPSDMAELYAKTGAGAARQLTDLNADVLRGIPIAAVDSFTFVSNDNRFQVEAFLVRPLGVVERPTDTAASPRHPLIVEIHGGPHGQNGPAFNFQDQVYAARGWATLHVNYRGSSGYGQKFTDAIFRDQDGDEGQDVMYGVNAAVRRYLWIDPERMGIEGVSYGGQLTDWLITQTNEFKAAVPIAGISNLISFNYIAFYNQYGEMEFGQFFHQGTMMDEVWRRSALRYVAQVHTPTMLMHGENDPDVPISEAEQFYVALKDVGVEAVFVRYPREGHGLQETKHVIDGLDRKIAWYEKHFPPAGAPGVTNVQP